MQIIDCINYSEEYELLKTRIKYLKQHVDYFYLVTGSHYFTGKKKKNDFTRELKLASDEGVMLSVLEVNFTKIFKWHLLRLFWKRRLPKYTEDTQRKISITKIKQHFSENDVMVYSDIDEFPSIQAVGKFKALLKMLNRPFRVQLTNFYYNYRLFEDRDWLGPYVSTVSKANWQDLRLLEYTPLENRSGWHFSYMGGANVMREKLATFAHQDYAKLAFEDWNKVLSHIDNGEDLFGRSAYTFSHLNNLTEVYDEKILSLIQNNEYFSVQGISK